MMKHFTSMALMTAMLFLAAPTQAAIQGNDDKEKVSVPEDATVKEYLLTGQNVNPANEEQYENVSETVKVAFRGSDVYIQGLCAYDTEAWIKGVTNGDKATFATRQYVTTYSGTDLYMIGYDGKETDIVFNYYAESGILQTDHYIFCIDGENNAYQLLKNVMLSVQGGGQPEPVVYDVVTPPEDLQTSDYEFTATMLMPDGQGGWLQEPVKYNVRMGTNGTNVYVQGLAVYLPEAWIMGKRNASDGELTFASGQYYGQFTPEESVAFHLFFAAANYPVTNPVWIDEASFAFNASTGEYSSRQLLMLNASPSAVMPLEFYAGAKLKKADATGIEAAEAGILSESYTDLQGCKASAADRGLLLKTIRMADGTVKTVKVIRK